MAADTPTPDPQDDASIRPAPLPEAPLPESGGFVTRPLLTPDDANEGAPTEDLASETADVKNTASGDGASDDASDASLIDRMADTARRMAETAGGSLASVIGTSPAGDHPVDEAEAEVQEIEEVEVPAEEDRQPGESEELQAVGSFEGDLEITPVGPEDFAPEDLKRYLRTMMTSRKLDDKMLTLLKQGKGFFHIGSMGHEAAQVGLALHLRGGHDWFCMYYRDLGTALEAGMEPADVLRAHFAKKDDPFGGGRQMPEHFGHRALNIMRTSSSVGAQ